MLRSSLGLLLCVHARAGDVTVVRSDSRSVEIEYRPQYAEPRTVVARGTSYTLMDFQGGQTVSGSDAAGGPDLRYRYIPLAFPGERGNSLQVIAADYEDVSNTMVVPVPTLHRNEKAPASLAYKPDPARYRQSRFLPGSVADLAPVGKVRNMLLGGVLVTPFNTTRRPGRCANTPASSWR